MKETTLGNEPGTADINSDGKDNPQMISSGTNTSFASPSCISVEKIESIRRAYAKLKGPRLHRMPFKLIYLHVVLFISVAFSTTLISTIFSLPKTYGVMMILDDYSFYVVWGMKFIYAAVAFIHPVLYACYRRNCRDLQSYLRIWKEHCCWCSP